MNYIAKSIVVFVVCWALPALAAHDTKKDLGYPLSKVYGTALRYIRVDCDFEILEKEKDGGYIIFRFRLSSGKRVRAALELIDRGSLEKPLTRMLLGIDNAPAYLEMEFLEQLAQKIQQEQK